MICEQRAPLAVTALTSGITISDTTVPVGSTQHFLNADYVFIGNERVTYTGKTDTTFTGCIRGSGGTTAVSHGSGSHVYSRSTDVFNQMMGFNVAVISSEAGGVTFLIHMFWGFVRALPQIISWNYSFLTGSLLMVRYIGFILSAGLIFSIVVAFSSIMQGILVR